MESKTLSVHLDELRSLLLRLLIIWGGATLLVSFYTAPLLNFLLKPYGEGVSSTFLLLSPLEGWWTAFFVAMLGGALFALPLILLFLIAYLLPALYPDEGKKVIFVSGFIALFSFLGFFVGHYQFAPFMIKALQENIAVPGIPAYTLREALHFVVSIDMGVMVLFNLMGGLLIAVLKGWILPETLASWRRPYILGAFIAGAILTPPDVLSQVLMAGALIIGFEAVLFFGRFLK